MKALEFSAQLKQAGIYHFVAAPDATVQPEIYVRGPDGNEVPVRAISYRDGRILINFGTMQ